MPKKLTKTLLCFAISLSSLVSIDCMAITEEGVAAYYSNVFQGRKTVSGQRYDKRKLTAAHKTLALGTQVKVTNLKNNKSVVVTINDRGPHSKKRMLDLSLAAAKQLGLVKAGLGRVRLDTLN